MMSREAHIKWCKDRAIQELNYYGNNAGGFRNAIVSMMSDLRKHPETKDDVLEAICMMQLMSLDRQNRQTVIEFINGFH